MSSETSGAKLDRLLSPLIRLSRNWVSRTGVFIVTAAAVCFLFLLPTILTGSVSHPYLGILSFMILPGVFLLGLALIPLGLFFDRRAGGSKVLEPGERNWNHPMLRNLAFFVGAATLINILIFSQLSYRAVHFMDSTQFCGGACHQVMQPEFASYKNAPHSRVECVQCHVGPGAEWQLKAKISGIRQVIKVMLNTYSRPTPAPVHNLRPAQDTCGGCHWSQKSNGDRVRVIPKYAEDEANSLSKTVLLMHLGGGQTRKGIHGAHLDEAVTIRYRPADAKRETIPWVEYSRKGEASTVYLAEGAKPEEIEKLEVRQMDCIDCHNRPAHAYDQPDGAVNRALADGRIDTSLPFARKTALEILKKDYKQDEDRQVEASFVDFYRVKHPETFAAKKVAVESAAANLLAIYQRNIFPAMRVTWGTYPNHKGHTDFPGCFRCHDDEHKATGGKAITQDCKTCHEVLAVEEKDPKVLTDFGYQQ